MRRESTVLKVFARRQRSFFDLGGGKEVIWLMRADQLRSKLNGQSMYKLFLNETITDWGAIKNY